MANLIMLNLVAKLHNMQPLKHCKDGSKLQFGNHPTGVKPSSKVKYHFTFPVQGYANSFFICVLNLFFVHFTERVDTGSRTPRT
jgi:hypothetical protein